MAEGVSLPEALSIKETIANTPGIAQVAFLDDVLNIQEPLELQDSALVEESYKDQNALFTVTVEEGREQEAVLALRESLGESAFFSGAAADLPLLHI